MAHRLLFASIHSYLDPASGAALATRELLELLAARGWDCRALTCGVLDYQNETPLEDVLAAIERPTPRVGAALSRGGEAEVFDLELEGVRVTLLPTAFSRAERAPGPREGAMFLDLADQVLDRFAPEVLLTYGGHPVCLELMRRAKARGVAVVFHLHNFAYNDRRGFGDVSAFIFPSEYSRRHYRRRVGLDGVMIPDPIQLEKVVCRQWSVVSGQLLNTSDRAAVVGAETDVARPLQRTTDNEPRTPGGSREYVTFINPQPDKGAAVFARIALELGRRRPDIPLLVVEGRGKADGLAGLPVDLSGLTNLHRMANTPDPRDFYRVSRVVLMPSLWRESLGRVPIEAMANGIPVLASDRGALPETLGNAGFVFTIPERCTPASGVVPTTQEVAPWVAVIERLWDDPEFEAEHRRRALAEARRWDSTMLADQYEKFFLSLARG
jgi:glycosyltransferase involved in cell wall biosynthesis